MGTLPFSPDFIPTAPLSVGTPSSFDDRPASIGHIPSGGNHQAVHDVSSMIANLVSCQCLSSAFRFQLSCSSFVVQSSTVTAALESTPVTSVFLDECLHMFFVKFVPVFPVLHRSTFVFRECTQALLLNAIAIGSLYLGPKSAVAKGEVLWRLAHTAVATSWQILIAHRGSYDACQGVQLLVTALLGQVYGLLSKNRTIRTSSRAFHALAFYWAKHCGMYESEPYHLDHLPQAASSKEEKERQWRIWVAREIQQRAVLAHYMIDGLIAQMSGESTSVRHSANQLSLPSSEAAFAAETADDWLSLMQTEQGPRTSFRSIFRVLFSPVDDGRWLNYTLSAFSLRVLLEGFQSLISDCWNHDNDSDGDENDSSETHAPAIGIPTKPEIRRALVRAHDCIAQSVSFSTPERQELLLRWHALCLDALVSSTSLCRHLCRRHNINQHLWPGASPDTPLSPCPYPPNSSPIVPETPATITSSTSPHTISTRPRNRHKQQQQQQQQQQHSLPASSTARRALLHAAAIQDLVEMLPRGRAHAVHMPASLLAAATVYAAFALRGIATVRLPAKVEWAVVLGAAGQEDKVGSAGGAGGAEETARFVWGEIGGGAQRSGAGSDIRGGIGVEVAGAKDGGGYFGSAGTARNLVYEFNSMQKLFRCLSTQWGIAFDMETVVDQWNSICH
jgi:hypothetical protein